MDPGIKKAQPTLHKIYQPLNPFHNSIGLSIINMNSWDQQGVGAAGAGCSPKGLDLVCSQVRIPWESPLLRGLSWHSVRIRNSRRPNVTYRTPDGLYQKKYE